MTKHFSDICLRLLGFNGLATSRVPGSMLSDMDRSAGRGSSDPPWMARRGSSRCFPRHLTMGSSIEDRVRSPGVVTPEPPQQRVSVWVGE